MARVAIAVNDLPGTSHPAAAAITWTAGDATNDHEWSVNKGDILLLKFTGTVTATIDSVADGQGRVQDTVINGTNGDEYMAGPFGQEGWDQGDGKIHVDLDAANVELAVLRR